MNFISLVIMYTFQHHIYCNSRTVPNELQEIIDKTTYEKARVYGLDKSKFSMVKEFYSIVLTTVSWNGKYNNCVKIN